MTVDRRRLVQPPVPAEPGQLIGRQASGAAGVVAVVVAATLLQRCSGRAAAGGAARTGGGAVVVMLRCATVEAANDLAEAPAHRAHRAHVLIARVDRSAPLKQSDSRFLIRLKYPYNTRGTKNVKQQKNSL